MYIDVDRFRHPGPSCSPIWDGLAGFVHPPAHEAVRVDGSGPSGLCPRFQLLVWRMGCFYTGASPSIEGADQGPPVQGDAVGSRLPSF